MYKNSYLPVFLALLSILVITGFPNTIFAQDTPPADNISNHIVIEITGAAQYRDPDWADESWQPLSVGLPVRSDWIISPVGPSTVKILCAGGSETRIIREGSSSPDCVDIPPPPGIPNLMNRSRGNDPDKVSILAPINRIANVTPRIVWEPVIGYDKYQVSILYNGADIFTVEVEGTSFELTDDSLLQRSAQYTFRVTPLTLANDPQFGLRDFADVIIISSEEYDQVDNRRQQVETTIQAQVSAPEITIYTDAWTYYEFGLFSEAITQITSIITAPLNISGEAGRLSASPYAYILAGNSFSSLGYFNRALLYYNQAFRFAQTIGDKATMAIILTQMAEAEADEAIKACYLEKATDLNASLQNMAPIDIESINIQEDCS